MSNAVSDTVRCIKAVCGSPGHVFVLFVLIILHSLYLEYGRVRFPSG